jgi:hypothetical protein
MIAPQLTYAMIRNIDFQGDPHKAVKELNEVIAEKFLSDQGKCPHKPSNMVVQMSGDMAYKANGTFCLYCGSQIEIERIVWRVLPHLPTAPRSA